EQERSLLLVEHEQARAGEDFHLAGGLYRTHQVRHTVPCRAELGAVLRLDEAAARSSSADGSRAARRAAERAAERDGRPRNQADRSTELGAVAQDTEDVTGR